MSMVTLTLLIPPPPPPVFEEVPLPPPLPVVTVVGDGALVPEELDVNAAVLESDVLGVFDEVGAEVKLDDGLPFSVGGALGDLVGLNVPCVCVLDWVTGVGVFEDVREGVGVPLGVRVCDCDRVGLCVPVKVLEALGNVNNANSQHE
jgi:hypothetical protein